MDNIPDRINISEKAKVIVDRIDENKYLALNNPLTTRSELFLFALALGVDSGIATNIEKTHQGGFVLDKSLDPRTRAVIYALFINKLQGIELLDQITDKSLVYSLAQNYANTGFEVIDDYINNKDDNELMWDFFLELDEQYINITNLS